MITNILATITVCLVTNTSDTFPQYLVADPVTMNPSGTYDALFRGHFADVPNPTHKTVTVEVQEVTTLSFDWEGQRYGVNHYLVKSRTEASYVLKSTWEPAK